MKKLTNVALPGLRIRPNRSPSNFLSIGTPPRPQNPTKYIQAQRPGHAPTPYLQFPSALVRGVNQNNQAMSRTALNVVPFIEGAPPIAADPGGFLDFRIFRKMWILGIFRWDLGSGGVCNRWEMAVGFKWTDSQLISSHMGPFSTIFMISVILLSFPVV